MKGNEQMRGIRKWSGALALLVATAGLAGCGSSGGGESGDQSSYNSMSVADLAAKAATEGSVTWYVAIGEKDIPPIVAAFNKTYPNIKVQVLRLSADQIPARVMTEQKGGKYNADVITGDALQVVQLEHAGALPPYDPPDTPDLPEGLSLPSGYRAVAYVNTTVIAYNPDEIAKLHLSPPTSWQDLTKPEWKGHFSVDPSAVSWYDSLIHTMGHDQALALFKALGENDPIPVESHSQAIDQVASGEPPAGATIYGYMASTTKKKTPTRMEFTNPNPLPVSLNLTSIGKNAPHPAAARLFDNWLVSKEGQQAIVDVSGDTSLRPDVKNDTSVWDPTRWEPAWGNPMLSPDDYKTELAEMKSAFHVQ